MRRLLLCTAAAMLAVAAPALAAPKAKPAATKAPMAPPDVRGTAEALRDKALIDTTAWTVLSSLTSEVGGRPTGSPQMTEAKDWALATLTRLGFSNVHAEPFVKRNAWLRGAEHAEIAGPNPRPLAILGLGNSVPTPPEGIEAEIKVFASLNDMLAMPPGSLAGKIAVVNQPMTKTQSGEGYGYAVRARSGASEAAKRGAVAYLTRSISTGDSRLPHTGSMNYAAGAPKIPAAALGVPDAERLALLAAKGPVRVRLQLASTVIPEAPAWNVVGEIRGRETPDEIVLVGGHLDSWDPAEGAIDDGAGIAISAAAAKLIGDLPQHPKRTVRVVFWGSEETGGSGAAYAEAHKDELSKIVLAGESDLGSGRIYRADLPAGVAANPAFAHLTAVLAPVKTIVGRDPAVHGGSDTEDMQRLGVPVVDLNQDATRYFDIHHSADDTLNKVDPADLAQNVAVWAAVLWTAAETGVDFRTAGAK